MIPNGSGGAPSALRDLYDDGRHIDENRLDRRGRRHARYIRRGRAGRLHGPRHHVRPGHRRVRGKREPRLVHGGTARAQLYVLHRIRHAQAVHEPGQLHTQAQLHRPGLCLRRAEQLERREPTGLSEDTRQRDGVHRGRHGRGDGPAALLHKGGHGAGRLRRVQGLLRHTGGGPTTRRASPATTARSPTRCRSGRRWNGAATG